MNTGVTRAAWTTTTDSAVARAALNVPSIEDISNPTWSDILNKPESFLPVAHNHSWNAITDKPTTLAGYGITDELTISSTWSDISNKPTTLAGYGLFIDAADIEPTADRLWYNPSIETRLINAESKVSFPGFGITGLTACVGNDARLSDARTPLAHNQDWSTITNRPTSLDGYGIVGITADSVAETTNKKWFTPTVLAGLETAWTFAITSNSVSDKAYTDAQISAQSIALDSRLATAEAKVSFPGFGTTGSTACVGNDTRLSDARTPLTHTHIQSELTGLTTGDSPSFTGLSLSTALPISSGGTGVTTLEALQALIGATEGGNQSPWTNNIDGGGYSLTNISGIDLSSTWNNASTTFTALKLNVTDTQSAAASLLMDLQVAGVSKFNVDKNGKLICSDFGLIAGNLNITAGDVRIRTDTGKIAFGASIDTFLAYDAAGILAQRNGFNPQTLRIYNTYTNTTNYERAAIGWNANSLIIGTEAAGTGWIRAIRLNGQVGINRDPYSSFALSVSGAAYATSLIMSGAGALAWDGVGQVYASSTLGFYTTLKFNNIQTALGTTVADGLVLTNTTAAALNAQQYSPATHWIGQGWATTPANSQTVEFRSYVAPVQGASNPTAIWKLEKQINGGGWSTALSVDSWGSFSCNAFSALGQSTLTSVFAASLNASGSSNYLAFNLGNATTGGVISRNITSDTATTLVINLAGATPTSTAKVLDCQIGGVSKMWVDYQGNLNATNSINVASYIGKQIVTASSATPTIDWTAGTNFTLTLSANTTITFSNAMDTMGVDIAITNTSSNYTVTWPAGIKWVGGVAPVQTIGAKTDLYSFTQTGGVIYGSVKPADPVSIPTQFGITIGDGANPITTGVKGVIRIPYNTTITGWDIVGDQSGSCVLDLKTDTYTNFAFSQSIVGSQPPSITGNVKNQYTSLSSWTTSLTAGDYIQFSVTSSTGFTKLTLNVYGNRIS